MTSVVALAIIHVIMIVGPLGLGLCELLAWLAERAAPDCEG